MLFAVVVLAFEHTSVCMDIIVNKVTSKLKGCRIYGFYNSSYFIPKCSCCSNVTFLFLIVSYVIIRLGSFYYNEKYYATY